MASRAPPEDAARIDERLRLADDSTGSPLDVITLPHQERMRARLLPGEARMLSIRSLLVIVGSLPLLIAGGTWVIGEQVEVAVLRTFSSDGREHETKLWVVDHMGQPWLRGARPHLGWLDRIRSNPRVELERNGITIAHTATIEESPDAKRALEAAMAAKYGWIDRWYETLFRFDPVFVRLDPAPGAG